jgi:hypothetical protein
MARDAELRARITAKDDASKVIDKVADAAQDLEKKPVEVEIDADVQGALSALDQVAAEAKQTAEAADALGRALGPDLAAKADTTAIVGDLKNMGLSLDQIKGNADQLGAKMRELSDVDVGGKLGSSLGTTRGKLDELRDSGDQTGSVLANMAGNSTQDMAQLAGVTGTAGMAMGQLAEYATEGNISMSSLAKTAGPMLLLALATQAVSSELNKFRKIDAFNTERVDAYFDAIKEGGTAFEALANELEDTGEIGVKINDLFGKEGLFGQEMFGGWSGELDAAAGMHAFGMEIKDFLDLAKKGPATIKAWGDAQVKGGADTKETALMVAMLTQEHGNLSKAEERAKTTAELLGDERALGTTALEDQQDELKKLAASHEAAAAATAEDAAAAAAYAETIGGIDWAATGGIDSAVAGMSAFHDQFFSLADIASDNEAAFDSFGKALKDNGKSFDLNTEKGRDNQQALENLAATLDVQLAAALADSGGSLEVFQGKAADVAATLRNRLINELHMSGSAADDVIRRLGLMPEDVETRYNLSGTEDARAKLDLLSSSIDDLPKNVKTTVTQQIIAGDYQGALATIQNYYNNHPATVKVNVTMGQIPVAGILSSISTTKAAATVVPVSLQLPTAGEIARQIGRVRLPFSVASSLRSDERLSGARDL